MQITRRILLHVVSTSERPQRRVKMHTMHTIQIHKINSVSKKGFHISSSVENKRFHISLSVELISMDRRWCKAKRLACGVRVLGSTPCLATMIIEIGHLLLPCTL